MPQTNEVLEFTQLIGPFYEFVDDRAEQNCPVTIKKKLNKSIPSKSNLNEPLVNGNSDGTVRLLISVLPTLIKVFQMVIIRITRTARHSSWSPVVTDRCLRRLHPLRLHRPSRHQVGSASLSQLSRLHSFVQMSKNSTMIHPIVFRIISIFLPSKTTSTFISLPIRRLTSTAVRMEIRIPPVRVRIVITITSLIPLSRPAVLRSVITARRAAREILLLR